MTATVPEAAPGAQALTEALTAAGFTPSTNGSAGFRVQPRPVRPGVFCVDHGPGGGQGGYAHREAVARYAVALRAAGHAVENSSGDHINGLPVLLVTPAPRPAEPTTEQRTAAYLTAGKLRRRVVELVVAAANVRDEADGLMYDCDRDFYTRDAEKTEDIARRATWAADDILRAYRRHSTNIVALAQYGEELLEQTEARTDQSTAVSRTLARYQRMVQHKRHVPVH